MTIRILLLSALALIGWRFFVRRNKLPFHIALVAIVLGLAAIAVVFPELTNDVARSVGRRPRRRPDHVPDRGWPVVRDRPLLHEVRSQLEGQITKLVRELALVRRELDELRPASVPARTDDR